MNRLIALMYFVLSLIGLDPGGSSFEHRASENGAEVLLSRAHVEAGVARFDCVHSASGQCHYLVLPRDCDSAADANAVEACAQAPIARFTLANGESHQVPGLQQFRLCVGPDRDPSGQACESATPGVRQDG